MKISRFSIRRPILTVMVSFIVIILGGISLSRLSIDLMPDVSPPTLSVSASYENASPEDVEQRTEAYWVEAARLEERRAIGLSGEKAAKTQAVRDAVNNLSEIEAKQLDHQRAADEARRNTE